MERENSIIDPRNRSLIDWDPETRTFYADISTLEANGISLISYHGKKCIWIQSHKFNCDIRFICRRNEFDENGDIGSWIFESVLPDWIFDDRMMNILQATEGIKLVIYND